ncbi:hypothetical protein ABT236_03920 [Streptomyces sp. NPDC001523]|uniref:hypothetical protein n=1 Tax=Streptomyces sp. NPDC001523 TaxID=3154383 RepID=UPI00331E5693
MALIEAAASRRTPSPAALSFNRRLRVVVEVPDRPEEPSLLQEIFVRDAHGHERRQNAFSEPGFGRRSVRMIRPLVALSLS